MPTWAVATAGLGLGLSVGAVLGVTLGHGTASLLVFVSGLAVLIASTLILEAADKRGRMDRRLAANRLGFMLRAATPSRNGYRYSRSLRRR